jgi:hypothetical protein
MIRRLLAGPALLNPFFPETLRWGPADLPDPPTAASFSEFLKIARGRREKIGRNCAVSSIGGRAATLTLTDRGTSEA